MSAKTECCVIGHPIAHSLSPEIHQAGYDACGLTEFHFSKVEVPSEDLERFLEGIARTKMRGVSITLPHKQAVLPLLDELDPLAAKIGAVNTIVVRNGRLKGYNTDCKGVTEPLKAVGSLVGKSVLVLGAGGAARAAVFGLLAENANVSIFNRTVERAADLAKASGAIVEKKLESVGDFDVVINMTSVGMVPKIESSPIDARQLRSHQVVFDAVYNPLETQLIREAAILGCTTIPGSEMFLHQALEQFKLFTAHTAPISAMRKALMKALKNE